MIKVALKVFICLLPWRIRRCLLVKVMGYDLSPESRIGFSYVFPRKLVMAAGSRIGNLNYIGNIDEVIINKSSSIGNLNWVTGFPTGTNSRHFSHQIERVALLYMGDHAAITHRHLIDCTNQIWIGSYSTIAGFNSQILTHSINIETNRQESNPVTIGSYCFVGTRCVLLPGCSLPEKSILAAGAVLNKSFMEPLSVYGGCPARFLKYCDSNSAYFNRLSGYVW